MPLYPYYNIDNEEETCDMFFNMNDTKPDIIEKDGKKWKRSWQGLNVQGRVDGKYNAWDIEDQMKKTAKKSGKLGDLWDFAREMSEKRAEQNNGIDPLKQKVYDEYSKKHKGAPHPDIVAKNENAEFVVGDKGVEKIIKPT